MERQNGLLGRSNSFWAVAGLMSLAGAALVICALAVFIFGLDIGVGAN